MGSARTADQVTIAGRTLEYVWVGRSSSRAPIVFLHEGLGSIELWREFPQEVCAVTRRRGLVYSRAGNGWSEPLTVPRQPNYMHEEAHVVLPEVIGKLVDQPPVLIGHSDGASIAIIYAGGGKPVEAMVLIAPHVFVEDQSIAAITAARDDFADTDLPERMAKYHHDPAATFRGWNDIWLSPAFQDWNLEAYLPGIDCPLLLVQGEADEFGTRAQLESIQSQVRCFVTRLLVPDSGHSPHLAQPDLVAASIDQFLADIR